MDIEVNVINTNSEFDSEDTCRIYISEENLRKINEVKVPSNCFSANMSITGKIYVPFSEIEAKMVNVSIHKNGAVSVCAREYPDSSIFYEGVFTQLLT